MWRSTMAAAGRLIVEGLTVEESAKAAIIGPLSDEVGVSNGLKWWMPIWTRPDRWPDSPGASPLDILG